MPLLEMLQVLSRTPVTEPQLRAVVAVTCARWCVARGEDGEAQRLLTHALELVPDLRPAMRLLYRIFLRRRDIRNSVRYLDQEIRATRHPREAAALYRERGQLVEAHFRDRSAALQCYQAALKATPRDLAVLRSVEAVALAQGNVFSLISNLEAQLEVLHDPRAVAAVARDLALIEARNGGDLALGVELLHAAAEEQPKNLTLAQDLFRMAEAAQNPDMMLRALELEADARPPELRAVPLTRASLTLREMRDRAGAVTLLHAAARAQPHNISLWRNLEELSMATARYDVAVHACAGQLKAIGADDPPVQAELYYRLGKLAMIRLDRVTEGLAAMRKALKLFPGHIPALEDAGRYLIANDAWSQLLELLKLQVATADDAGLSPEEKAQAQLRAGQVLEENLGELEGARKIYEEAVATCPTFRPALDRLERVHHQLGRFEGLRELYQGELTRGAAGPRRVYLLSLLARLHANHGDANAAIKALVSLLKDFPEHMPSIQLLARLLARAGRARELLQVTEQEIKLTISDARQAKLLYRSAELSLELGDRAHAEACLLQALETVHDHQPSMALLERILRDRSDGLGLALLLRRRLAAAPDPEERLSLHLEVVHLQIALGDPDAALAEIDPILAGWPEHLTTLLLGVRLASATGHTAQRLRYLERHFAVTRSERTRALLAYRTGLSRQDPRESVADLRRAIALWPQLGGVHLTHLAFAEATGDAALRTAARTGLELARGAGERQACALRLAEHSLATPRPAGPEQATPVSAALPLLHALAAARPDDLGAALRLARNARAAGQPALAAAAFAAAAGNLAAPPSDALHTLRYRAARAAEQVGDLAHLGLAEALHGAVADADPRHEVARRGRARASQARAAPTACRAAAVELGAAAGEATVKAEKAVLLTRAAELLARAGDLNDARARVDAALTACPQYLPAMFVRTCLLEQLGDELAARAAAEPKVDGPTSAPPRRPTPPPLPYDLAAVDALEALAAALPAPAAYPYLCRGGLLAIEAREPVRAWRLLGRALELEPGSPLAFSLLWRLREQSGKEGARPLAQHLARRFAALQAGDALDVPAARALGRLALDSDGAAAAQNLLEQAAELHPRSVAVRVDLARAYARAGRWSDAAAQVVRAIADEPAPERKAMLEHLAADAHERAGMPEVAFEHYLNASRGGYLPQHALAAADRIASAIGTVEQRVEVLSLLIHQGDVDERVRSLRALAELARGPLGKPDQAVNLLRDLLKLRPANTDVILDLHHLLGELGRTDEGRVALQAGIAAQRAILRDRGLSSTGESTADPLDPDPVLGLLRLFDAAEEPGGVYVCAAILESIDADLVPANRRCDVVVPEPWPLPNAPDKPPPFFAVDDPACAAAVGLLRTGVQDLSAIPGAPPPAVNLSQRHSLPPTSAIGTATRAIARTLNLPEPLLFLNPADEHGVVAHVGTAPVLLIGRKVNAHPFGAASRDAIGRALLRLATGGDHLHREMSDEQIVGVLQGMAATGGSELETILRVDQDVADAILEALSGAALPVDFGEDAEALARHIQRFSVRQLREVLRAAEDRAGTIACGDPRVALTDESRFPALSTRRAAALVAYLVSEEHLALRRVLGYHVELELDDADMEEVAS